MNLLTEYSNQSLQLAEQSKKLAPTLDEAVALLTKREFFFEVKFDGVRCLAIVNNGAVVLKNRNGRDISFRYPDVIDALATTFFNRSIVLDGELIVLGKDGRPDFSGIARRDAQARAIPALIAKYPATYMIFDVLHFEGTDTRPWPYQGRMNLAKVEAERSSTPVLQWSVADSNGAAMLQFVRDNALEGLIAKRHNAPYRGGRSNGWYKIKQAFQISCSVTGYTAGKGSREGGIGALELALYLNDEAFAFGEVGTGFDMRELAMLKTRIDAKEELVVEIEVNAVTKDIKPRFPVYKGLRTDKMPTDCTADQLFGVPVI